jgi:FMN phosphatase YigB (HAD superfamily)
MAGTARKRPTLPTASSTARGGALSSDVWYTLIYVTPATRRSLHARRRRIWTEPLLRRGWSRSGADRWFEELAAWKERTEAAGTTPPIAEQVLWLSRHARVALDVRAIEEGLDRALLSAEVRVAPGAAASLATLEREGVPLAVVSNVANETGRAARAVLDRAGLLARFRVVYLSCEHPRSKPSGEPFRQVARFLDVAPARLVHIGDLTYDIDGALRAGAAPVLFSRFARWNRYLKGSSRADGHGSPAAVVRDWSAVPTTFRRLTARGPPSSA